MAIASSSGTAQMTAADLQSDGQQQRALIEMSVLSEDEDEGGEFGCDEDGEDDNDACDPTSGFAMPTLLQVCPVDDLAVEERRWRHSQRNNNSSGGHGKGKNAKRMCGFRESAQRAELLRPTAAPTGGVPPQLRRDSMAIRQQYWKQLGFNLTHIDLKRTIERKKERQKGLKVRQNDAPTKKGESKNFFQFIASWYGANNSQQEQKCANSEEETTAAANEQRERRSSRCRKTDESASTQSSSSASTGPPERKTIHFNDEAELHNSGSSGCAVDHE